MCFGALEPFDPDYLQDLKMALGELGTLLSKQGRPEEAARELLAAAKIAEELMKLEPTVPSRIEHYAYAKLTIIPSGARQSRERENVERPTES